MLVGGIIDFGFAFNAQIGLTHAAREGARAEALRVGNGRDVALDNFDAPATANADAQVLPTVGACDDSSVERVTVQVTAEYSWFFLFIFDDRELVGEAVMRCGG